MSNQTRLARAGITAQPDDAAGGRSSTVVASGVNVVAATRTPNEKALPRAAQLLQFLVASVQHVLRKGQTSNLGPAIAVGTGMMIMMMKLLLLLMVPIGGGGGCRCTRCCCCCTRRCGVESSGRQSIVIVMAFVALFGQGPKLDGMRIDQHCRRGKVVGRQFSIRRFFQIVWFPIGRRVIVFGQGRRMTFFFVFFFFIVIVVVAVAILLVVVVVPHGGGGGRIFLVIVAGRLMRRGAGEATAQHCLSLSNKQPKRHGEKETHTES
mmetsp:Transcript_2088/g.5113  ORF Transcript_2088/g.5113 Transcript_2088/m.5113 type:complete len:265 (+) Transcript_2088:1120-1914(+)